MRHDFDHDGRRISYLEHHAPGGPLKGTLVLLHAFPLAAEMWRPQLTALPAGWRVVAPDLAGFGESSPGTSASPAIDDYARDVLALLDHLQLDAAVVAGLSMGGYLVFALQRLAPARLRGVVLADTRPEADTEQGRALRIATLDTLERDGPGGVANAMISKLLGATTRSARQDLVAAVRTLVSAQPADGIRRAVLALRSRPDSTPVLREITGPSVVIAGEEDEIAGPEIARHMHGQIAGAELALIGGAGHLSNLERPEAFNLALSRFLATRFA
jgi:pimeloyl-ACP methyl ester carboxylesterase